jgi:hypothetical protein
MLFGGQGHWPYFFIFYEKNLGSKLERIVYSRRQNAQKMYKNAQKIYQNI